MNTEPYKGVRDFYPEDMAVQNYIFSVWRETAEKALYKEYNASILEYSELYRNKGSAEIISEQTYSFIDRGGREVTLRPEMTPTLARMIAARRKSLKFPLRWYSIPNLFRYERPQRGRKREHWQLNCDLIGVSGPEADIEIISLSHGIMKAFGADDNDFIIKIGSRKALTEELTKRKIPLDAHKKISQLIDRKDKMPESERISELKSLGADFDIPESEDVKNIRDGLAKKDIKNTVFDANIVRGFDYYTGIVFEVFDTNEENRRSLFGGGRYDNLLEVFGEKALPFVGFGMGDVTIKDFLETHNLPTSNE